MGVFFVPLFVVKVFAFYIGSAVCFHCLFLFVILFVALSSCILFWCVLLCSSLGVLVCLILFFVVGCYFISIIGMFKLCVC